VKEGLESLKYKATNIAHGLYELAGQVIGNVQSAFEPRVYTKADQEFRRGLVLFGIALLLSPILKGCASAPPDTSNTMPIPRLIDPEAESIDPRYNVVARGYDLLPINPNDQGMESFRNLEDIYKDMERLRFEGKIEIIEFDEEAARILNLDNNPRSIKSVPMLLIDGVYLPVEGIDDHIFMSIIDRNDGLQVRSYSVEDAMNFVVANMQPVETVSSDKLNQPFSYQIGDQTFKIGHGKRNATVPVNVYAQTPKINGRPSQFIISFEHQGQQVVRMIDAHFVNPALTTLTNSNDIETRHHRFRHGIDRVLNPHTTTLFDELFKNRHTILDASSSQQHKFTVANNTTFLGGTPVYIVTATTEAALTSANGHEHIKLLKVSLDGSEQQLFYYSIFRQDYTAVRPGARAHTNGYALSSTAMSMYGLPYYAGKYVQNIQNVYPYRGGTIHHISPELNNIMSASQSMTQRPWYTRLASATSGNLLGVAGLIVDINDIFPLRSISDAQNVVTNTGVDITSITTMMVSENQRKAGVYNDALVIPELANGSFNQEQVQGYDGKIVLLQSRDNQLFPSNSYSGPTHYVRRETPTPYGDLEPRINFVLLPDSTETVTALSMVSPAVAGREYHQEDLMPNAHDLAEQGLGRFYAEIPIPTNYIEDISLDQNNPIISEQQLITAGITYIKTTSTVDYVTIGPQSTPSQFLYDTYVYGIQTDSGTQYFMLRTARDNSDTRAQQSPTSSN
jgi:hypothetical protein